MAKLKKFCFNVPSARYRNRKCIELQLNIRKDGLFYTPLLQEVRELPSVENVLRSHKCYIGSMRGNSYILADVLENLERCLKALYTAVYNTNTREENVIRYAVKINGACAVDNDGNVYGNGYAASAAGVPDCEWTNVIYDEIEQYPTFRPNLGFGLILSAGAFTKVTTVYPDGSETYEYDRYYGEGGDHLGCSTPAEKLNTWASPLPKDCPELPYSDKLALFFHRILEGLCRMSLEVKRVLDDSDKVVELANSGYRLLGGR